MNSATLERTESYGYDASLDYLTSTSYGDGLPSASPTWSYDAAGNRGDALCDNLNRATSLGGVACQNDVLGNRTVNGMRKTGLLYGWDCLNRLASFTDRGAGAQRGGDYAYRADGMRVWKAVGTLASGEPGHAGMTAVTETRYRHDGQMGIEDVETQGANTTVTRYGLGARGVDLIERTSSSGTVTGFPVYDAHGNDVATLTRSGTGYSVNDRRSYDAWGVVRAQQSAGDPKLRYCASLGHRQDDESGLVYMRARYYEPTSGRFVSEDPARDGTNWFAYCRNNPTNLTDQDGQHPALIIAGAIAFAGLVAGLFRCIISGNWTWSNFGVGFLEGAIICGAGIAGGPIGGALAGMAVGGHRRLPDGRECFSRNVHRRSRGRRGWRPVACSGGCEKAGDPLPATEFRHRSSRSRRIGTQFGGVPMSPATAAKLRGRALAVRGLAWAFGVGVPLLLWQAWTAKSSGEAAFLVFASLLVGLGAAIWRRLATATQATVTMLSRLNADRVTSAAFEDSYGPIERLTFRLFFGPIIPEPSRFRDVIVSVEALGTRHDLLAEYFEREATLAVKPQDAGGRLGL